MIYDRVLQQDLDHDHPFKPHTHGIDQIENLNLRLSAIEALAKQSVAYAHEHEQYMQQEDIDRAIAALGEWVGAELDEVMQNKADVARIYEKIEVITNKINWMANELRSRSKVGHSHTDIKIAIDLLKDEFKRTQQMQTTPFSLDMGTFTPK